MQAQTVRDKRLCGMHFMTSQHVPILACYFTAHPSMYFPISTVFFVFLYPFNLYAVSTRYGLFLIRSAWNGGHSIMGLAVSFDLQI